MRPTLALGFTVIEMMIAFAVVAVLVLMVGLRMETWQDAEEAKTASRTVEGAFSFARSEAIRTGNNHMLFFATDIPGAVLNDASGTPVPILILDDGRPGSGNQNCLIDGGEPIQGVRIDGNVSFGTTTATAQVPIDEGPSPYAAGFSFQDAGGGAANWVMFRPDGTPRAVDGACAMGGLGTGGGAVYLSNAERDVAIVLTPLGAARVFAWNEGSSSWN